MSYTHSSDWVDSFLHQDEGPLFQFAGTRSLTANRLALEAAKQFINEGRSEEAVRQKTGWFIGEDQKWRYEISDHDSVLNHNRFQRTATAYEFRGTLGQLLDHPKLYAAYPFLANIPVAAKVGEQEVDEGGFIASTVNQLSVIPARIEVSSNSAEKLHLNLLHEIQHAIQDVEHFANGTNRDYLWGAYLSALSDREQVLMSRRNALQLSPDTRGVLGRELDIIEAELSHITFAHEQALEGHWNDHFLKLYLNYSGEREARKTARDWKLTPAERLEREPIFPEIPNFKPIITFNGAPYQTVAAELNLTPKAHITLLPKESIIKLTQAADRDTFNHECGHLFLRFEGITTQGRKPSEFQNKILNYLGVNSFSEIKREHDEKFARGFEQYLREIEKERAREQNEPKGINKVFSTVKSWIGNVGKQLIEIETPLSPAAREMFQELVSTARPVNPINSAMAETKSKQLAMQLIKTGIYERAEAYSCARIFAEYALAKCERDPDFPTVDRVFDQLNLKVERAEEADLKSDIKFDFESFDLDTLVREKVIRTTPNPAENLQGYDLEGIDKTFKNERAKSTAMKFDR